MVQMQESVGAAPSEDCLPAGDSGEAVKAPGPGPPLLTWALCAPGAVPPENRAELARLLTAVPALRQVAADELSALAARAELQRLAPGQLDVQRGDPVGSMRLVVAGRVVLYYPAAHTRREAPAPDEEDLEATGAEEAGGGEAGAGASSSGSRRGSEAEPPHTPLATSPPAAGQTSPAPGKSPLRPGPGQRPHPPSPLRPGAGDHHSHPQHHIYSPKSTRPTSIPPHLARLNISLSDLSPPSSPVWVPPGPLGKPDSPSPSGKSVTVMGGRVLRIVGPGGFYGEDVLLRGDARHKASAKAIAPVTVATLSREAIAAVLGHAEQERTTRVQLLQQVEYLRGMAPELISELVDRLEGVTVPAGEAVVREGDLGDRLFLVAAGTLRAYQDTSGEAGLGRHTRELSAGAVFGELSLMYDVPRDATIVAQGPCDLYVLRRRTWAAMVKRSPILEQHFKTATLGRSEVLGAVDVEARMRLVPHLREVHLSPGDTLLEEGAVVSGVFLVIAGVLSEERVGLPYGRYNDGACLAIREVLEGRTYNGTVTAEGTAMAFELPGAQLRELLDGGHVDASSLFSDSVQRPKSAPAWPVKMEAHRFGFDFGVARRLTPTAEQSHLRFNCEACVSSGFHPELDRRFRESKTCQDALSVRDDLYVDDESMRVTMMAIYDGHGKFGHVAAGWLEEEVPKLLLDSMLFPSDLPGALREVFPLAEKELAATAGVDMRASGSTATVVLQHQGQLTVAWVGDSRAVLASRNERKGLVAQDLTQDHKLEGEEAERILARGHAIIAQEMPGHETLRVPDPTLPQRLWHKKMPKAGPGLNMSRSLGDTFATMMGCIPEPEVAERAITGADAFIIVASDGLWEVFESEEACEFVVDYILGNREVSGELPGRGDRPRHLPVSLALAQAAQRRWFERYGADEIVDDTSVLVHFLQNWTDNPALGFNPSPLLIADVR